MKEENQQINISKPITSFFKYTWIYWVIIIVIAVAGFGIIDMLFPSTPIYTTYTWNGIGMFMAICAGIGWIIHGTGFLLVRR